jgi:hypothetical protein
VIDPHEPAAVRLRNQAIRQAIAVKEAAGMEKAMDENVRHVSAEMTPYLRYLDELEAPRSLTREQ